MSADVPFAVIQATGSDTLGAVSTGSTLAIVQVVALVLIALGVLALFGLLLRIALEMQDLQSGIRRLVQRSEERLDPVAERARRVAENVDYVSRVVREDVEGLGESVERMRGRLDDASDRMEERVEEFNALMELVQSEAEEIFLDTASTVRGVRAGSRKLGERRRRDDEDGEG